MRDLLRPATAEFVGVIFLVFIGAGSIVTAAAIGAPDSHAALVGIALAHGLALAIAVSATMNVSGGHINPAVTIAAYLTRKVDARTTGVYVVAQLLGAVVAAAFVRATLPMGAFQAAAGGVPAISGISALQAVVLELILTFFLVFAVWGTAVSKHHPAGIAGFGIGLTIAFDILVGGPFTGAAMNPARWFGPALVTGAWSHAWVYIAGPILGGTLAAAVYEHVLEKRDDSH